MEFFDDDYWLSHENYLTSEQADADVAEICGHLVTFAGRLLDAPCGTGRIAARLSQLGFEVDAVDLDPRALSLARSQQRGLSRTVTYFERDLRKLIGLGSYEVIVSWFNSFGYFTSEENQQLLDTYTSLLRPGGVLLINTLDLGEVRTILREGPLEETIEVRGRTISSTAELVENRLVTNRVGQGGGELRHRTSSVELFTKAQWSDLLMSRGFTAVEVIPRVQPSLGDPVAEVTVRAVL